MNFDEFLAEYRRLFKLMMGYTPNECGSAVYAEKMAELSDKYPEYTERTELEGF